MKTCTKSAELRFRPNRPAAAALKGPPFLMLFCHEFNRIFSRIFGRILAIELTDIRPAGRESADAAGTWAGRKAERR